MTSKIYFEDFCIIRNYIEEINNIREDFEKKILQLETNSDDIRLYEFLYKNISRIRRGASFLGLSALVKLTYEMRFIVDRVKALNSQNITECIDNLLLTMDFANSYISRLNDYLNKPDLCSKEHNAYILFETSFNEDLIFDSLEEFNKKLKYEENKVSSGQGIINCTSDNFTAEENIQNELAEDVKEQFIYENTEHLEVIENNILIRLYNNQNDREAVNEIFRSIHSIKAGAGLYLSTLSADDSNYDETKNLLEIVHRFEDLLTLVRDKQYAFDKNLVDLTFKVIEYLKSFNQFLALGEGFFESYESILDNLNFELSNFQQMPTIELIKNNSVYEKAEEITEDIKSKTNIVQSIRVRQDKIDNIINMISELVIAKSTFSHIYDILNRDYRLPEIYREIRQVGDYVNSISDKLQNSIMSIRMVEIKTVFQKMHRVVRDIAQNSGKSIELIMEGENTEIDKSVIEFISDPLVHIIRNSADHGIETCNERLSLGKPGTGKIILRAYRKDKNVFIEVEDDGRGIDPGKIKEKAIEKRIISEGEAENMNNRQLINLIFLPGFSTAEKITEVSGRGVGMDIVKSNISKINGSISVESTVGKGTKMIIKLPLSLAISPISHGLVVECAGSTYIIPLDSIVETVNINRNNIHHYKGRYFTYLRGTVIGLEWLSKILLLGEREMEKEELNAVILTNGIKNFAVIVDRLKNEQEFVMKRLEGHLASIPGILGSTIFDNGKIVLIVNSSDVIKLAETVEADNEIRRKG